MWFLPVRKGVRKLSGTTKTSFLVPLCNCLFGIGLGGQGLSFVPHSTPGSSGFRRGVVVRYRLLPTKGGRLPTAIQDNQRSQGCALAPQAEASMFCFGHSACVCSSGETGACVVGASVRRRFVSSSSCSYGCDQKGRAQFFRHCLRAESAATDSSRSAFPSWMDVRRDGDRHAADRRDRLLHGMTRRFWAVPDSAQSRSARIFFSRTSDLRRFAKLCSQSLNRVVRPSGCSFGSVELAAISPHIYPSSFYEEN